MSSSELEWWASDGEKGTAPRNSEVIEGPPARPLVAWKDLVEDMPIYDKANVISTNRIPSREGDSYLGQHLLESLRKKKKEKKITKKEEIILQAIYKERKKYFDTTEDEGKGKSEGSRSVVHSSFNIQSRLDDAFKNKKFTTNGEMFKFIEPKQSNAQGVIRLQFINLPSSFTAAGGPKGTGTQKSIHDITSLHYHFYGEEKTNGVFGHIKFTSQIGTKNLPVTFFIELKTNGQSIYKLLDNDKNTYRARQKSFHKFKIILGNFLKDYGVTKTVANEQVPFLLEALKEMIARALSIYKVLPSNNVLRMGGKRKTYKRKRKSSKRKTKKRKKKRKTRRKRKYRKKRTKRRR